MLLYIYRSKQFLVHCFHMFFHFLIFIKEMGFPSYFCEFTEICSHIRICYVECSFFFFTYLQPSVCTKPSVEIYWFLRKNQMENSRSDSLYKIRTLSVLDFFFCWIQKLFVSIYKAVLADSVRFFDNHPEEF